MTPAGDEAMRLLSDGLALLPDKPEESPESTLRALWHLAAGHRLSAGLAMQTPLPELDASQAIALRELVLRRISGLPLAHMTGRQRFCDLEMLAGPGALIPRRETELLARSAIEMAGRFARAQGGVLALDVCTGCGNVALAMAGHVLEATVFAADLSEDAVALARRNAEHLGLSGRTEFRSGDLLQPFDESRFLGRVDLLTCNPPYISSAKVPQMASEIAGHEPHLAFDGGPFGVAILLRLLEDAPRFLRPGGWLLFEVGLGQGHSIARRMQKAGPYRDVTTLKDEKDQVRALAAQV